MSVLQKRKRLYERCAKIRTIRYAFNNGHWHDRSAMGWQIMFEYIRDERMSKRLSRKRFREIMRKAGKRCYK